MQRASLFSLLGLLSLGCSSADPPATAADTGTATDIGAEAAVDAFPEAGGCTSARTTAIGPIDAVSKGTVTALTGGLFVVDATAGGFDVAKNNPWIYVSLATGKRVDLTDKQAFDSSDWDLGLKRAVIRANDGDSGPGGGGAQFLADKTFEAVGKADATKLVTESWFDDMCTAKVDATGAIVSSFAGWYDYDAATMVLYPQPGVWVVRGAKGTLYKLEIQDYYSNVDGTTGATSAHYKLHWAVLE